jgi:flavodoxin
MFLLFNHAEKRAIPVQNSGRNVFTALTGALPPTGETVSYLFIREPEYPYGELMKYIIVYWSRYGNGKKVVDYLTGALNAKGAETQMFKTDEADPTAMPKADVYIFSAPAEAFNLQKNMKAFMKNLQGMEEKKYGIINTHGMKKNRLDKMEKLLSKKKMVKVASVDFHVGEGTQTGNGLTAGWETKLKEFAGKL